jgi:DNA-binding transcriptional regulator YiaG
MAKRKTRKYTRRTLGDRIADLEAQIAALRARAKDLERFSPEAIKKDRERLELTAKDYADLVGVSMITIYSWESGRSRPRAEQLEKWLAVKGMPKEAAWRKLGIEEVPEFNGKAILAERRRLGLSAANYGKLVGVSMLSVYNWEKDKSVPRGLTLEKWLAVRGIGKAKAEKRLGMG